MSLRLNLAALLVLLLSIYSIAGQNIPTTRETYRPLYRLNPQNVPNFYDDMDFDSLINCAKHQIAYLERQEPGKNISFADDLYDNRWLLLSAKELLSQLLHNPGREELNRFLKENYIVYQAGGRTGKGFRNMLVTGYYEPVFSGSLTRKSPFLTPIYAPPKSLVSLRDNKKTRIGRYSRDGRFVNYWSRAEIENNNLLKGYELAFLSDPFDAFLLHVQGSGRIRLPDNSVRSVRFAGSNGLDYRSIGKLLVDEKIMPLEEVNIPAIRKYLQEHPEQQQRILHHNPRFIFFTWSDTLSPKGSSGEELTPGRSIALDTSALPGGTIGYLVSRRPVLDADNAIRGWKPLSRLVFPQDSGAAIKGTGRVDIFWGNGHYAEVAANHMKEDGQLFFLVKKGYPGTRE
jgi:membrane-bound lytic murein transglycosylase A